MTPSHRYLSTHLEFSKKSAFKINLKATNSDLKFILKIIIFNKILNMNPTGCYPYPLAKPTRVPMWLSLFLSQ